MFWEILEIEETKDVKKITQAYRKKLVKTNPEDKPEEFKILRQAYEQALEFARNNTVKKSPIEDWKEKLVELYNDFPRRIQVKEWQALCNEDVCISLDKRFLVEETLLKFFMDHYRIPHIIWTYLNEQFDFVGHVEELYDAYPKEFIDYIVINGIRFEDALPYELFVPGKDANEIETYFNLYLQASREGLDVAYMAVQQMQLLSESHPYGIIQKIKIEYEMGLREDLQPLWDLYEQYPDNETVIFNLADLLYKQEKYEEAENLCRKILEFYDNQRAKWLLANCLGNQEKYKEAIELLHELMSASGGDQALLYELSQKRMEWNVFLIEKYEKILKEDFDDHQNRVDLTWAYLQNDRLDESYELSKTLELEKMEPFDYYNLMSNIQISKENYQEAIPLIDQLLSIIEHMEDDGEAKTQKRIKRYPEILNRKGFCLFALHKEDEGMDVYKQALRVSHENAEILTRVCQISISRKDYEQAEEYARRLIEVNPQGYHGYLLLAYSLFHQNYDREAFEALNQSIEMYGGDLEAYILKIRIMARNNAYEGAHEIIRYLEENGLEQDLQVLFCKGLLKETEEEDEQAALELYQQAAKQITETGVFNFAAEMYYRMLWIQGNVLNVNKDKDYKVLMALANKGLKEDPRHYGLKDYKAWLLLRKNKFKQALKIYKDLETYPHHTSDVETQIGYIYYQYLEKHAQDALTYYLRSIQAEDSGNKRFYAGMCYMYLKNYEEAEKQFLTLQQMNPEGLDSYFRLSAVYEATNQWDKALENINKSIEIISKRPGDQSRYYRCKVRILRRMKRVDEAVDVMRFIMETYKDTYARRVIIEIYCQYGNWQKAQEEMEKWKMEDEKSYDPEPEIRMHIVNNNFQKARDVFNAYKGNMQKGQLLSLEKTMNQIEVNLEEELKTLHAQEAFYSTLQNSDMSHVYMNLSQCYYRLHNTEKQVEYAKKALKIINKNLKKISLDHTLYYGRKSKVLALLNKEKEARKNLEIAKQSPLCDFCPYSGCKDADIYETNMEEFFGNNRTAIQLAKEYLEKWPDEDDFMVEIEQIKKKEDA